MSGEPLVQARSRRPVTNDPRAQLLAGLPVSEQQIHPAGLSTTVLAGGDGPPVVLLHGPGEYAAKWMRVIPDLVRTHRVIAPDLPGHGTSEGPGDELEVHRILAWLGELIERTCPSPPALVGHILGGALAARFAARERHRLHRLVLVDTLGLAPFQPEPAFGRALTAFIEQPTGETHDRFWQECAYDLDALRRQPGTRWEALRAYNLDLLRTPSAKAALHAFMNAFGMTPIPPAELSGIAVPTTLIWGRHDRANPLQIAERASARYGWPLHVVEGCADDPPFEQPEAFLNVLLPVLGDRPGGGTP